MSNDTDHYAVLGVRPGASRDEIRRAWIRLARSHHPDTAVGGPADRERAEAMMRRMNEAWTVLGDERSRAEYDARRAATIDSSRATAHVRSAADHAGATRWHEPMVETVGTSDGHGLGCLAAVALLVVLAGIFVLSAYATTSDPSTTTTSSTVADAIAVGDCAVIVPSPSGLVAQGVSCGAPNSGRVVAIVESPRPCPRGTPRAVADRRVILCMEAP